MGRPSGPFRFRRHSDRRHCPGFRVLAGAVCRRACFLIRTRLYFSADTFRLIENPWPRSGVPQFKADFKSVFSGDNVLKLIRPVAVLFLLNLIDAVVSILWVRGGVATEGNHLMATLLAAGDLPFLAAKLGMGAVTCAVLLYGAEFRLARIGVSLALTVYVVVMGLHVGTGLAVYGFLS